MGVGGAAPSPQAPPRGGGGGGGAGGEELQAHRLGAELLEAPDGLGDLEVVVGRERAHRRLQPRVLGDRHGDLRREPAARRRGPADLWHHRRRVGRGGRHRLLLLLMLCAKAREAWARGWLGRFVVTRGGRGVGSRHGRHAARYPRRRTGVGGVSTAGFRGEAFGKQTRAFASMASANADGAATLAASDRVGLAGTPPTCSTAPAATTASSAGGPNTPAGRCLRAGLLQHSPGLGQATEVLDMLETEVIGSSGADVHENEPSGINDGTRAPDEYKHRSDGQCVETGQPALWVALRLRGGGDDNEDDERVSSQRFYDAAAGRSPRASDSAREQIDPLSRQIDPPSMQVDPPSVQINTPSVQIDPRSMQIDPTSVQADPPSSPGYSPEPSPTGDGQTEQPPRGGQPTPFIPPPLGGGVGPERGANRGKRPAPGRGARERRREKRAREHGPRLLYGALPPPQPPTQHPPPLPPPPKPPPPPLTGPERAQQAAWYAPGYVRRSNPRGEPKARLAEATLRASAAVRVAAAAVATCRTIPAGKPPTPAAMPPPPAAMPPPSAATPRPSAATPPPSAAMPPPSAAMPRPAPRLRCRTPRL